MLKALSPIQCRVAREALGWTQKDLADHSQLSLSSVRRFELGQPVHVAFGDTLLRTFTSAGVVLFDDGAMVEGQRVRFGVIVKS